MSLVHNPHTNLTLPSDSSSVFLIRGSLNYYHYVCDGLDDRGWGCGYRTLQTIFSWIKETQELCQISEICPHSVPSILDIQKALVDMGDKSQNFVGSKQWIGSVEITYCIEYFYKVCKRQLIETLKIVQCRLMHTRDINDLKQQTNAIADHFTEFGSPIMMGGDEDCSSKCILGISICPEDIKLLILDPHYSGSTTSREELQFHGWVKWQSIDSLNHTSFYNLCCPLLKVKN